VATAPVGEFADLKLPDWSQWQVRVAASAQSLLAAGQRALLDVESRAALRLRVLDAGLLRGSIFVYYTEEQAEGAQVSAPRYKAVCLRADKIMRVLLADPARWWSWGELINRIGQARPKADPATIDAYLQALIGNGVLLHDLQPPTVGQHPELHFAEVVAQRPGLAGLAEQSRTMLQLTAEPLPLLSPRLSTLWAELAAHPWVAERAPQLEGSQTPDREGTLGQAILRAQGLQGGLPRDLLRQLSQCMQATPFLWRQPSEALRTRLSDELAQGTVARRVPLLELVYRVPLPASASGLALLPEGGQPTASDLQRQGIDAYLRDRLWDADLSQQICWELDPIATERALRPAALFPEPASQMESMLRLVKHGGRPTLVHYYSTSHLGRLVNRFLQGDKQDPLYLQLRSIWDQQERALAPAIVAEITSGGGGRVRDIGVRPLTYRHQIVVNGPASVPPEQQIHLHELSVYLDRDGPVLWWEKKGVRVIPRQLSALMLQCFSPTVHVLLALDPSSRHWNLPLPVSGLPVRTARITYKDIILRPQTWLLPPNLGRELRKPRKEWNERKLKEQLAAWRDRHQVPRTVRLGDMEHNAVDLQGPMVLSDLATMVEDGLDRVQEEFLHEDSPVHGPDGPVVAEAVVHLQLRVDRAGPAGITTPSALAAASEPVVSSLAPGQLETATLRRGHVFPPGSAWLYLKLYSGHGLGSDPTTRAFLDDELLGRFIAPLVSELEASGQISDFHFVRYADPEAHLRLRLKPAGKSAMQLLETVAARLNQEAQARAFQRFTIDTYEREVDRYGGSALIESAERLFTADSRLCLRLLAAQQRDRIEPEIELGILSPIFTLHTLLAGLGLDLSARERFLSQLRESLLPADRRRPEQKTAMDADYRRHAGLLQTLLRHHEAEPGVSPPPPFLQPELVAWYSEYQQTLAQVAPAYRQAATEGRLSAPLSEILGSLFHMHCNRLLGSREREARVVYFAQRSTEALLARRRASRK
jgi:thiopeptide-type bacteriocin biosynthesis protein